MTPSSQAISKKVLVALRPMARLSATVQATPSLAASLASSAPGFWLPGSWHARAEGLPSSVGALASRQVNRFVAPPDTASITKPMPSWQSTS